MITKFPTQDELKAPLLVLLLCKGAPTASMRAIDTYRPLADFFDLHPDLRDELRSTPGKGRKWDAHVCYVREKLKVGGLLDTAAPRGTWRLTEAGRKAAAAHAQSALFATHARRRFLHAPR